MPILTQSKKNSFFKIFFRFFLIIIVLMVPLLAALPSILSSNWVKDKLIFYFNNKIPGKINVENLSLSWFGPQHFNDISLFDSQDHLIVSVKSLDLSGSLFKLLISPLSSGLIEFQALNANLISDDEGYTNLAKAWDKNCCKESVNKSVPFLNIALNDTNGLLNLSSTNSPLTLELKGQTAQNGLNGQFLVSAEIQGITFKDLIDNKNDVAYLLQTKPDSAIKVHANIANFPVMLIDQMVFIKSPEYLGILTKILGKELNLTINQQTINKSLLFDINATSNNFTGKANLLVDHEISLRNPTKIIFEIPSKPAQELLNQFCDSCEIFSALKAELSIKDLHLPLSALNGGLTLESLHLIELSALLNLPLDTLQYHSILASTLIGSQVDLGFSLQKENDASLATIQIKSEKLEIPPVNFLINSHLNLQKPLQIVLTINPSLFNPLFLDSGLQMQGPATAQLAINSLSMPMKNFFSSSTMVYKTEIDALLKVSSIRLVNIPHIGAMSLNDFSFHLVNHLKMAPELNVSFNLQPDGNSFLSDIIGKKAAFKTLATMGLDGLGHLNLNVINLQALSDLIRLELSGKVQEDNRLVLNSPSLFNYTFTENALKTLGITTDLYEFKQLSPLEININSSNIPLSLKDLSFLRMSGTLKINDFQLLQKMGNKQALATLDHLLANWSMDAATNLITANFTGFTRLGENQAAGKLTGFGSLNEWINDGHVDLTQSTFHLNAKASNLPVELICALTNQKNLLPILGNRVDLSIDTYTPLTLSKNGSLSIDVSSDNLSGKIALDLGEMIQLNQNKPAEFILNLTPQGYLALRSFINEKNTNDFTLLEPGKVNLLINSLNLPKSLSFIHAGISGHFSLNHLVGIDPKTKNKMILNSLEGNISSQYLAKEILFDLNAQGTTESSVPISCMLKGSLRDAFLPDSSLNKKNLSLFLDAKLDSLPLPLFCQFACVDPKFKQKIEVVIGPLINAKIYAQLEDMNGPLYIDVKGSNGQFTVDADLNKDILTLKNNFKAELKVTPALGEDVLKDLIPVLSGMEKASHPITLTIDKNGFTLPIHHFSLKTLFINQAILTLGKVHFSAHSQLAKVLALLVPSIEDQLVWLTPAYFSLKNGLVKLERVDMLINDRYPLATWGDVDITNDRVNMIVGLSAAAISQAFDISGIPPYFLLQLPLKGRLNNPSIDKTKAVARLSALVAESHGGPHGKILGTVLGIASGSLSENAAPNPTTNPLPWSDLLRSNLSEQSPVEEKPTKSSFSEIQKTAGSLLNKFFK